VNDVDKEKDIKYETKSVCIVSDFCLILHVSNAYVILTFDSCRVMLNYTYGYTGTLP